VHGDPWEYGKWLVNVGKGGDSGWSSGVKVGQRMYTGCEHLSLGSETGEIICQRSVNGGERRTPTRGNKVNGGKWSVNVRKEGERGRLSRIKVGQGMGISRIHPSLGSYTGGIVHQRR
jgi:hypothetical protein